MAGYAGSALFSLILLGHEFDVFWSRADSGAPSAPFAFDFTREGRHLERVLGELGPT